MKKHFVFGIFAMSLIITSCSKVPQAEIDVAKAAIEEAKLMQADLYIPDVFMALEDSMKAVMEDVESQKSKLFKNYSTIKEDLVKISQLASDVKQQAETRKNEVKLEIENLLKEVQTIVNENKQLVQKAPKGKEGASALVAIKSEISIIEASIIECNSLYEKAEYLPALDKISASKEKAVSINEELNTVIVKYKSAKK